MADSPLKLRISGRSNRLIQSEIRNMSIECDNVKGINLSQGICDLELAGPVREGAVEAIRQGINYYTRYDGLQCLREAISKKVSSYNKINCDPEKNIIVSGGATGAFYCACLALLDPGDEVIVFEPYYGYHINTLHAAGAIPRYVRMTPPLWSFDKADLEKMVSVRTKGIVINTPANPSGKVFNKDELLLLSEFAIRHDLFIFTDEIYEYFVYDDNTHISPASIKEIFDRTITISGYSKTYSITGWRIGYCVCHEKWATTIGYVNDLVYVCGPAPLQMGVADGINQLPDSFYENIRLTYKRMRDKICGTLHSIGLIPFVPQGAYYVLADVSKIPGKSSKEKAMRLLYDTGVACVPGTAFFHDDSGENLVRFCFAKREDVLDEACRKLSLINY